MTSVLWLRRDLRAADHPAGWEALRAAAGNAATGEVVVLFVVDPALWEGAGPVRRGWLARTLREVSEESFAGRLVLRHGDPGDVVPRLTREVSADSVHISRETTPAGRRRDGAVAEILAAQGCSLVETGTTYAVGPGSVTTGAGTPYQVFTPFLRAWQGHGWPAPAPVLPPAEEWAAALPSDPSAAAAVDRAVREAPEGLLPKAGEGAAHAHWASFRDGALAAYARDRDRPDRDGTSGVSPHLKLGVLHPRTLLHDLRGRTDEGARTFVRELAWREFYADVLWHQPASAWRDLRPALRGLAYDPPGELVAAWREGRTGFPIVDAGMRQLAATGWMHNRVRMITASFLTKDLHTWWPVGARHFLDRLVDGDLASNSHGWQWVAGTGTDAAPYFRVFNPVSQGLRFDPHGDYVRRWVPELAHLPGPLAHEPWRTPTGLAYGYPPRIVDHDEQRREALARYAAARTDPTVGTAP
jgi:deoxyribodipyrimidine photo-lyase